MTAALSPEYTELTTLLQGSAYFIRLLGWFQSDEYVHIAME